MENSAENKKEKKSFTFPVILGVVWILIILLFGYSIWVEKDNETDNTIYDETTFISGSDANTETIQPAEQLTEEETNQARIRDSKRFSDIMRFRSALESYRVDNGNYPESLENLIPDYTDYLPQNPTPYGSTYVYTGIGTRPYSYYDLSYTLEVGVEGIDPGLHIATPSGPATP